MSCEAEPDKVREILETDRGWCAYALADLEPGERAHCTWLVESQSVLLVYRGLEPPVLFAYGAEEECERLVSHVPPGRYVYTLLPALRRRLERQLKILHEVDMWRMVLTAQRLPARLGEGCVRLGPADQSALEALFDGHPDRPDAFHPRQLETGVFMGIPGDSGLVAVAGTHIVARTFGLAAVGNVFTAPAQRGRGLAGRTTGAVVAALRQEGVGTIVLNVSQSNAPAVRCYHRLGFRNHCAYREGIADLGAAPN